MQSVDCLYATRAVSHPPDSWSLASRNPFQGRIDVLRTGFLTSSDPALLKTSHTPFSITRSLSYQLTSFYTSLTLTFSQLPQPSPSSKQLLHNCSQIFLPSISLSQSPHLSPVLHPHGYTNIPTSFALRADKHGRGSVPLLRGPVVSWLVRHSCSPMVAVRLVRSIFTRVYPSAP